ncbi:MAG: HNH endonuclease [Eubacteriales bacterium]|nr:HNH endonuclease [Eubacteriales bacterium]
MCKTIYVPQENIEEFAANSQTTQLFGNGVDITSLLTKLSVGTGVIVTLVILNKVGFSSPIASVVAAAADKSLQFASNGAAIGSLFGGLTRAADEIDESGRTSAVIGFATATAGFILSIVSLVASVPSGGSSAITTVVGIKLFLAGVSVLAATVGTAYSGYQAVKKIISTEASDIDWANIDWEKVGASAAEKAIENAANGYMWGSVIGAVYGGVDGYDFYHKYNTPYTKKSNRLILTPKEGEKGHWSGERGESDFILDTPIELPDGTKITKITYRNAVPDFSPYQKAQVRIARMTHRRLGKGGNYNQADEVLAKLWSESRHNGIKNWTARDVEIYRTENNLTWHEMSNMEYMQLVPYDVNHTFTHYGGVAEYNAMIGQTGGADFD